MKLKRGILTALMLLSILVVKAQDWSSPEIESMLRQYVKQTFEVNGRVFGVDDYEPNPYPLQSANIKVTCMGDTTAFDGAAAGPDGSFWTYMSRRDRLKDTRLHITISYLGMQTLDSIIDPPMKRESGIHTYTVELDSIVLRSNPLTTEEVEIVAELQRMYQRGDTVIFNADAYEMPTGSVLLDLVRRLPGLKYEDGKMTYLGRDIEEIRLNGDSFFKRDMSIALNNMPTDKLKSLKVYEVPDDTLNAMSDNHLIMDMETKEPIDRTTFANVELGTTENFDKYQISVDGSTWKQKGGEIYGSYSHNTIPYEYSRQLKTERTNGNLYYSRDFEKVYVNASAGYNSNYSENKSANYNKMFMPEYTQNSVSENTNSNGGHGWNGNVGVNGRALENNMWYGLNMDMNRNWNNSNSENTDSISNEGEGLISSTHQTNSNESTSKSYNLNGNVSTSFSEESKYSLYVNFGVGREENDGTSINKTESRFAQLGDSVRKVDHRIYSPGESNNYRLNATLQRSMGEKGYIGLGYSFSYNKGKSIQSYEDMADDGTLSPVDSLYYDRRNSQLNNEVNLDYYYTDSVYRINLSGRVSPLVQTIDNYNRQPAKDDEHIRYSGVRYSVNGGFRVKVFKKSQIGLTYNGSNGLPSVTQLSEVTDYSDPMNIREGNSSLKNSFSHNTTLEFQLQSYMRTSISYGTTINEITTLTRLDRQTGARITSPENINGSWNMREYLFLTYPFHDLSLNFTVNHSLNHNVAYVQSTDAAPNKSATDYNQLSLSLEGAFSDRFWMLSSNVGYTMDKSKSDYLDTSSGGKRFTASAQISYQSSFGLGASTRLNYNRPFGYEMESANRPECLWSISAEYRFLKERRAMLSFTWRDILKSYSGFSAYASGTNWSESRTFGDTSMFVIAFSYRFNDFR